MFATVADRRVSSLECQWQVAQAREMGSIRSEWETVWCEEYVWRGALHVEAGQEGLVAQGNRICGAHGEGDWRQYTQETTEEEGNRRPDLLSLFISRMSTWFAPSSSSYIFFSMFLIITRTCWDNYSFCIVLNSIVTMTYVCLCSERQQKRAPPQHGRRGSI